MPDEGMQPKNPTEAPIDMEAFRAEIAEMIVKRGNMPTEQKMVLSELTESDYRMWQKTKNYKKGSVTMAELTAYRAETTQSGIKTRQIFTGTFISNILGGPLMEEELEKFNAQFLQRPK